MSQFDDEFAEEARRAEAEEKAKQESRKKGGNFQFEEIKWTGFGDAPDSKILRFVGKHPDLHLGTTLPNSEPYDARVVNMSRLVADNGKQMDMILPLKDRDPNHIMWRIIDRVNSVEWRKKPDPKDPKKTINEKVYLYQNKFPDIFGIVNWSSLPADNPQRKFGLIGRGWSGREVLIANVIDRSIQDWHSANKHTALLAKKISTKANPDGSVTEFVEKGVPAYGLNSLLNNLRKTYGDWEKFDIGFTRTGSKDTPNQVFNATRTPEQAPDNLQALVSSEGQLTSEEATYQRYDISKLFKVTTYTKLWNRLKLTIERIDACLGTHYADELQKLAEKEAEERSANSESSEDAVSEEQPNEEATAANEATPEPVKTDAPVVRRAVSSGKIQVTDLPGYSVLSDSEKSNIVSVDGVQGKTYKISYNDISKGLAECPVCATPSPGDFAACPGCGSTFSF